MMQAPRGRDQWLLFFAVSILFIALSAGLRMYALPLFALLAAGVVWWLLRGPTPEQTQSMERSLYLASTELQEVVGAYESFCDSPAPEMLADRTLYRPALMDPGVDSEPIQRFFFEYQAARRFLHRLPARMSSCSSLDQLEHLLTITDERTASLQVAWREAYIAAARLGTDYRVDPHRGRELPGGDDPGDEDAG
ncbi:hypothetical protein [Corynebacterium aquilae]|uniref:hypothetical protein n=1 Tax=Corynebacterium aquilae TaxID=203263 RepID=UPI0009516124|nr:hypothetical protein [Corynebacterium aquilae]